MPPFFVWGNTHCSHHATAHLSNLYRWHLCDCITDTFKMFSSRIRRKELIKTCYLLDLLRSSGKEAEISSMALLDDYQYAWVFCSFTRSLFSEAVSRISNRFSWHQAAPRGPKRSCFYSTESQKSHSRCYSKHSTGHSFPILLTPKTDLKILKASGQLQSTHNNHATHQPCPPPFCMVSHWFV